MLAAAVEWIGPHYRISCGYDSGGYSIREAVAAVAEIRIIEVIRPERVHQGSIIRTITIIEYNRGGHIVKREFRSVENRYLMRHYIKSIKLIILVYC